MAFTTAGWRLISFLWLLTCIAGFLSPMQSRSCSPTSLFRQEWQTTATCLRVSSNLPLGELLKKLDQRGIRYPPSASRSDLEQLLEQGAVSSAPEASGVPASVASALPSDSKKELPLTLLLVQLDIRSIRYEPSATRSELELLLKQSDESIEDRETESPLKELLAQLDERKIQYPPSASRQELERLMQNSRGVSTKRRTYPQLKNEKPLVEAPFIRNELPLKELLAQLDERNIRYPPSASRQELKKLLQSSRDNRRKMRSAASLKKEDRLVEARAIQDGLPLKELLAQELDARKIRYPPSASRQELKKLLQHGRNVSTKRRTDPSLKNEEPLVEHPVVQDEIPLKELLAQLDEKNIRYPPSASRQQLEKLLQSSSDVFTKRRTDPSRKNEEPRVDHPVIQDEPLKNEDPLVEDTFIQNELPLKELLAQLDEESIRYPPSASRQELEKLLQSSSDVSIKRRTDPQLKNEEPRVEDRLYQDDVSGTTRAIPKGQASNRKIPIHAILDELDRRQIRYAPNASRTELENLLKESNRHVRRRQQRTERTPSPSSLKDRVVAQSSKLPRPTRRTIESLRPGLSNVASKAARQANQWKRSVSEYLSVDEEGVREAEWYYESKDDPIDVKAVPMRPKKVTPPPRQSTPRSQPKPRRRPVDGVRRVAPTRPNKEQKMTNISYLLPPSGARQIPDLQDDKTESKAKKRKEPPQTRRRQVYNPYGSDPVDTRDPFDRFGDAIADAAEAVIWGPLEGDQEADDGGKESVRRRRPEKKHSSKARFWKDRMEEQIDYMLGIHDDESSYDNWENEVGGERQHTERSNKFINDAKKKKQSKKLPIWEEEGSLVSLLFGRRPSGGQLKLERFFEQEIGTNVLTKLISSIMKGGLIFASYVCRWASVRGAIPQPVVVMAVASAIVSARRPRQRINMVILTLVVIRTLGELIHGYIQGDQDWEDNNTHELARDGPSGEESDNSADWDGDGL